MLLTIVHVLVALVLLVAVPVSAEAPQPAATEIAQTVSMPLEDAARAGIVDVSAKGGFSGDQVAVQLKGARIPGAPIQMTFHIELFGADASGAAWPPSKAAEMKAAVEGRLAGLTAPDGTPVGVQLDVRVRAGSDASGGSPGYHQIDLIDKGAGQLANVSYPTPLGVPRTGEWGAHEPAGTWAHEVLHLANLKDQYRALAPTYVVNGMEYPLPVYSGDGSQASKNDFVENVLFPAIDKLEAQYGRGEIKSGVPPGHENDIMANSGNPVATVLPEDMQRIVDMAGIRLHVPPGTILLNKDGESQNFGVGAPLDLYAARGETVRVEGLYVYCIDFERHVPTVDTRFDVLGPASGVPHPEFAALQSLLEAIAQHQDPADVLAPLGAQSAVWSVTDGHDPTSNVYAMAFLAEAGIVWDPSTFAATPHFTDPNAAGPATAGVTTTGVLPPLTVLAGPSPTPPDELEQPAHLALALVSPSVVRSGETVGLTVLVENGSDLLTIAVERHKGKKWRTVGDPFVRGAPAGLDTFDLPAPAKKAKYRLRVAGQVDVVEARFKVKKGRKRR